MRDPAFDPLRSAPVPDSFEAQMDRLRARPHRPAAPGRAAALVAVLAVAVGACAIPVEVERPLAYAVRWVVSGATDEAHPSVRALEAAVPSADRLLSSVEDAADETRFRYVVAGPPPDLGAVRAAAGVSGVRVVPLAEPVRVPLGVWAADRLGAPRAVTVGLGSARLSDAEVGRLLSRQLAAAGVDTTALVLAVGRDDGQRSLRLRIRTTQAGVVEQTVPVGPDTRVRVWGDKGVLVDGVDRGIRAPLDSAALARGARVVVNGLGESSQAFTPAELDSLLRSKGLDDLADEIGRRFRDSTLFRSPPPSP